MLNLVLRVEHDKLGRFQINDNLVSFPKNIPDYVC